MTDGKKIMYEIYREQHAGDYRVIYYTELGEHEKDYALSEAMNGDHIYSGYLQFRDREHAKSAISSLLDRLNSGERLSEEQVGLALNGLG
jgi:hypothetical protein